jgi:MFS superfamily sulfate permease-like transporter
VMSDLNGFVSQFTRPNFAGFTDSRIWVYGFTIAVVASIETLLCIEATDRLDPLKRYTPTNHELKAQGIGNIVSGFLGGLPITSVIVRSSANVNAGARTKISTIVHGTLILVCVAAVPFLLNKIPLAALAAILLLTGYKLTRPALYKHMWKAGFYQFAPFIVTILAIVFTDLLKGVALGMVFSIFFILRENLKSPYFFKREEHHDGDLIHIKLAQEVSFLNKAAIKLTLEKLPENSYVIIDANETVYIDHDVLELIREFQTYKAAERNIRLELIGFNSETNLNNTLSKQHVFSEHTEESREEMLDSGHPASRYKELVESLKSGKAKKAEIK